MSKPVNALRRDIEILEAASKAAGEIVGRFAHEMDRRFKELEARLGTLSLVPGPPGERGSPGEPGPRGSDGGKGERGEQGPPGVNGHNGRDGERGQDGRQGPQGEQGHVGDPGIQGPPGAHGEPGKPGSDGRSWIPAGTWVAEAAYHAFDVVQHDGGAWLAKYDAPGEIAGPGWQLIVSRGRAGKPGEAGREGPAGPQGTAGRDGKDGAELVEVVRSDDGSRLIYALSNGKHVEAEL